MSDAEQSAIDEKQQRALVHQLLRDEFTTFHPLWVERQLAILTSLRRAFGNDLDKPIILGAIGQFMFQNMPDASHRYEDHLSGNQPVLPTRLTNVESIANSTGIPRESVRRKIGELMDIGWITRDPKGGLFVTATAANELDKTTQVVFRLFEDLFELMTASLAASGAAILVKPANNAPEP